VPEEYIGFVFKVDELAKQRNQHEEDSKGGRTLHNFCCENIKTNINFIPTLYFWLLSIVLFLFKSTTFQRLNSVSVFG
jgi:hypothetical protein